VRARLMESSSKQYLRDNNNNVVGWDGLHHTVQIHLSERRNQS